MHVMTRDENNSRQAIFNNLPRVSGGGSGESIVEWAIIPNSEAKPL